MKQHIPEIILVLDIGFSSGGSTPGINTQREHCLHCFSDDQIYCSLETGKSPAFPALRTRSPGSVLPPESPPRGTEPSHSLKFVWPRSSRCCCDPQVAPKQRASDSVINYLCMFQNSSSGFVTASDPQCRKSSLTEEMRCSTGIIFCLKFILSFQKGLSKRNTEEF